MDRDPNASTVFVDLDERGSLLDPSRSTPLRSAAVPDFLRRHLAIPEDATDINVFVHGWMTSPDHAAQNAQKLRSKFLAQWEAEPDRYPALDQYRDYNVVVRWPSQGRYRRIRRRAHSLSIEGEAATIVTQLLGYLNEQRRPPEPGPDRLGTADGQFLHAIGHSFGGRFLCQAIQEAGPARPPTLSWNWKHDDLPYTVDSLLILQMAARPDVFTSTFRPLLDKAPLNCPVVLTRSRADHATGIWHRIAEGVPGIGHVGARTPPNLIKSLALRPVAEDYVREELEARIVNIDASWRFRRGRAWLLQGAHSDIAHDETAHLYLTLADLAR